MALILLTLWLEGSYKPPPDAVTPCRDGRDRPLDVADFRAGAEAGLRRVALSHCCFFGRDMWAAMLTVLQSVRLRIRDLLPLYMSCISSDVQEASSSACLSGVFPLDGWVGC